MEYNIHKEKLIIPDYGRHIHAFIKHAKEIKDKKERQKFCEGLILLLENIHYEGKATDENKQNLWNHINIMSGFELDIEFPYQVETKIENEKKPDTIKYSEKRKKFRHFGKNIGLIIEKIKESKDTKIQEYLTKLVVNYLKKSSQQWNKNPMDFSTLKNQFEQMSNGELKFPENLNTNK